MVGLFSCIGQLGTHRGSAELRWYIQIFGTKTSLMLGFFSMLMFLRRYLLFMVGRTTLSFKSLAKRERCYFAKLPNPNDAEFQKWLRGNEIEILIIMVDQVLSKKTLGIPKLGIINKHASALPANKGLFPYFWAKINNCHQGISFHKVTEDLDSGQILAQELNIPKRACRTMITFYNYVFDRYPTLRVGSAL